MWICLPYLSWYHALRFILWKKSTGICCKMSCFRPDEKQSYPKATWKSFISAFQKKLRKHPTKQKPYNTTSQYLLNQHLYSSAIRTYHHGSRHSRHPYRPGQQSQSTRHGTIHEIKFQAEAISSETCLICQVPEVIVTRRFAKRDVDTSSDDVSKGRNNSEKYGLQYEDDEDDTTVSWQLNGVDARAEEFIKKMKLTWSLEKQRSEENDTEKWARLYE